MIFSRMYAYVSFQSVYSKGRVLFEVFITCNGITAAKLENVYALVRRFLFHRILLPIPIGLAPMQAEYSQGKDRFFTMSASHQNLEQSAVLTYNYTS